MDLREAYGRVHERVLELLDEDDAGVEVPTTPGWTVKDLVAHLAGFFVAYKSGKGQEAFGPGWADEHVEARRDHSLQECIDEWTEHVRDPGGLFESSLATVAVSDGLAHEQDLRTAVGRPGGRNDAGIVPSVEMALAFVEKKTAEEDLPPLRVVTDDIDRTVGDGDPVATLHTSTFELFRTVHGRRTVDQVRAMKWEGDPGPWVSNLFIFGPTETEVEPAT
ncbi:MAG TPA: maleylpyruvate isomerase family mycothiol-dependent enzyme [Actinomycetota bacterium]|jgi:uncharacterized protein (TIGR03083 family)